MALPSTGHTSMHLPHPVHSPVTYLGETLTFASKPFSSFLTATTSERRSTSMEVSFSTSAARSMAKHAPQFLHSTRPLQVSSLAMPPSDSDLSTRTTFAPLSARDLAAVSPAGPPPIMRTSLVTFPPPSRTRNERTGVQRSNKDSRWKMLVRCLGWGREFRPRITSASVETGDVTIVVYVDPLGRGNGWQTRNGHHLARQGHDEPCAVAEPDLPHREVPALRCTLLRGVVRERVLGLRHAQRLLVVPGLLDRRDVRGRGTSVNNSVRAVDLLREDLDLLLDG